MQLPAGRRFPASSERRRRGDIMILRTRLSRGYSPDEVSDCRREKYQNMLGYVADWISGR